MVRLKLRGEEGVALVTVLLITVVLLVLVGGTMAYGLGSLNLSRRDQDWNAALAAAEAGIDDYLYRLNTNDQYYLYSGGALPPGDTSATSPFTSWVAVPNAQAASGTYFRYSVNTANLSSEGAIVLTSTGRVRKVTRTIQTTLRREAFIDYQYFTDYETKDPAAYDSSDDYTPSEAQTYCALHYYEGRDVDNRVDFAGDLDGDHCSDIYFGDADNLNGPVHSNDAIAISGDPTFSSTASNSWNTTGQRWWQNGTGSNPSFQPGNPSFHSALTMPPSNVALRADADGLIGGTGCLFTGPTAITFNAAGTMNVTSPFTRWPATGNNCQPGANRPLPANGVIYVQSVPTDTADPNYTAGCLTSTQINGTATVQHPLGYPQLYDVSVYDCRAGDVFLKGTLRGRATVAAENDLVVIDSVIYNGGTGGTDLLGLVANNNVEIYHPVGDEDTTPSSACTGNNVNGYCNLKNYAANPGATTSMVNPEIDAAILSLQHSFTVQNYKRGDNNLGAIKVVGAIAQKYRGAVGTLNNTGYGKDYNYDQRLKYQSPPRFLNPIAAAWQIVTWIERKAACAWNHALTTGCP
jgi:hypothetical protein